MKIIPLCLLSFSFLFSSYAAKPHMVSEVASLKCLSVESGDLDVISRMGITLKGAKRAEKKFVAQVVHTIVEMTNEQQAERLLSNLKVVFADKLRERTDGGCLPAHQLIRNEIHMARTCKTAKGRTFDIPGRESIFVHELGHFLANKHNLYPKYNQAVNKRKACKLTTYMTQTRAGTKHKNRNEEFAEAVAAYFTYSKELKRKCRKSYDFLKDELFFGSEVNCSSRTSSPKKKRSGGGFLGKIFKRN